MNYKKFWYKVGNTLKRRWSRHPLLFIHDNVNIVSQMIAAQTMLIATSQYYEKDMPCQSYNNETKEWKDDIIKANKESKEEFEMNKGIAIAENRMNFAWAVLNIYSIGLTGKEYKYEKFSLKNEIIKQFINQLKKYNLLRS
jgi:5'-3' exonuclease